VTKNISKEKQKEAKKMVFLIVYMSLVY